MLNFIDDDCVLFLWATSPKLKEALFVLNSWGFDHKTNLVWVKERIGMGYYFRNRHEHLLVGVRGRSAAAGRISETGFSAREKGSQGAQSAARPGT